MSKLPEDSPVPSSSSSQIIDSDEKTALAEKSSESGYLYDVSKAGPLVAADAQVLTPGFAILIWLGLRKRTDRPSNDAIATQESVFDGPHGIHYRPGPDWENSAYFDPSFRWTYLEQKKALRSSDLKILLWTLVMWLFVNIIRGNLTNATADNLLKDLNLTQADYNLGLTLQRVGFLIAELPSQIIGKKLGVDIWIPIQLTVMSILGLAQFWNTGKASFIAFRFCIALFQGGFIPDAILYLSYYYTKSELPVRLAIFWSMNSLSNIFTGFTSVGLIEMRGVLGYAGWRWMFLIHGLLSLVVAIASFFILSPSPSQTKRKWRPNGFFTDNQVKIIVNKVIRDDPGKAQMHNREALTLRFLWKSLKDFDLWPLYLIGLTFGLPAYPLTNYFQLSMRQLGFNRVFSNLLSVPYNVITMILLVVVTVASELFNSRSVLSVSENVWFLPFFIALIVLKNPKPWEYFALATGVLSYPYVHAIQAGWCSRNAGSVRTRTVASAMYNMFVQASGVIGANLYQASDAPRYYKANKALVGVIVFNIAILYPGTYLYYRLRNAYKAKKWDAMTIEQQSEYLRTTTDEGCRRLDFRFEY